MIRKPMELFAGNNIPVPNLLPYDGIVHYYGPVLDPVTADHYLGHMLHDISWKHDEAVIFGRHIITKRKVAWYGDQSFAYTYSNTTKEALPWTKELQELKTVTENYSGHLFNSCLLNLYHNGQEGMVWHSDDEKALGPDTVIASLSLGAARRFQFRHRTTKETLSLTLEHGSLLIMKGSTQSHWMHALPKTTKVTDPRVNLTFRTMINGRS